MQTMEQILRFVMLAVFFLIFYTIFYKCVQSKSSKPAKQTIEKPKNQSTVATINEPMKKAMTLEELAKHDGVQKPTVYIAVKNAIFDVSSCESYAPGGIYEKYAGKECSVALAKMSTDDKYFNCYDTYKYALSEMESLQGWFDFLKRKYPEVGCVTYSKKED